MVDQCEYAGSHHRKPTGTLKVTVPEKRMCKQILTFEQLKRLSGTGIIGALICALVYGPCRPAAGQGIVGDWAWLSGNNTINQKGIYGTQGVTAAENMPGARHMHSMVIDSKSRAVYLLGGSGYDGTDGSTMDTLGSNLRVTQHSLS